VADVGVLVPIAVALIVGNGLSPTAVLLPAALLYLVVSVLYRLPVPVQPLKALGAIAIAKGLGADEVAAAALLLGAVFVVLGATGIVDLAARVFPRAVIRGVQLTVGLLFLKIAWELVADPPSAFEPYAASARWLVPLGVLVVAAAVLLRRRPVALVLVSGGAVVALARTAGELDLGPSAIAAPSLDAATFWTAFTVLVIPQLPLSFANSCLATADAARTYFGERAARVRAGRLAASLGGANLLAGAIAGMPVCHGAGGLTAHVAFGARTGGAPLAMGAALLALALGVGAGLATLLAAFPLPILAGLLASAGLLHIALLRDLASPRAWAIAIGVGVVGFAWNLAGAVALGLAAWWLARLLEERVLVRVRRRAAAQEPQRSTL
ncbi:MAG TPA: molybdate transporter family protein, partial [Gaiellaceae bacterium]|nr:molybdate transporter family protein [Gaiellaceae bacterium]